MILSKNFRWFQCWKIAEIACLNLVIFTRDNYMAAQLVLLIYRSTLTPSSSSTVFTGSRSNNALASRRWKVHSRHRVLVVSHLLSETILTWIRDLDFDEPEGSPRSDGPLWRARLIQGHPRCFVGLTCLFQGLQIYSKLKDKSFFSHCVLPH